MDFRKSRFFPDVQPDIPAIAARVEAHFAAKGYEAATVPSLSGCEVSVSKGGVFKAVLGLRTALKIDLQASSGGLRAGAGVGIFGLQALPTVIMLFLFWPVVATQIWGIIRQSNLDDEAMAAIEEALAEGPSQTTTTTTTTVSPGEACSGCGEMLRTGARFCPACGTKAN